MDSITRESELSCAGLDRVQPNFFDNTAQLTVFRVDWRFLKRWDGLAEARTLELPNVNQRRRGAVAAIYHRISENLKVAVIRGAFDFALSGRLMILASIKRHSAPPFPKAEAPASAIVPREAQSA